MVDPFESPDGWNCQRAPSGDILNLPTVEDTFAADFELVDRENHFITGATLLFSARNNASRLVAITDLTVLDTYIRYERKVVIRLPRVGYLQS